MSSHGQGEPSSYKGENARLPLPDSSQNARAQSGVLAPMSCRSCRQRKAKCSRKIPTCETCGRHGFQCVYDAVPKKRVPNSHLVKELLHRVHSLEKQQGQQDVTPSHASIQQKSPSPRSAASSEIPAAPANPDLDLAARREILGVFFTHVHGNPYIFVHEGTFRRNVMNSRVSANLLYALFALSTCYADTTDQSARNNKAEDYLLLSEIPSLKMDFSIENIQLCIVQIICLVCLGQGTQAWMKLGIAIRMAQGMELHREHAKTLESSEDRHLARICVHTLYIMDRFCVCGTNRPMLFPEDDFQFLRLPNIEGADMDQNHHSSEHWAFNGGQFQQTISQTFTNITILLGRCNKYLQNGGVQGDSHFPWHPMSSLSGLIKDLEKWITQAQSETKPDDIDCSQTAVVDRYYLSWFICHAIFIRLYRQFLPLISGSALSHDLSEPWQQETSRKCVDHAVQISELCIQAHSHGYSWPYFTSFCLGSACTVLIHAAHYDSGEAHRTHLIFLVQKLLIMRHRYPLVDYQCDMLRKMHIIHTRMVRNYVSGTLITANMHLTQFYKRYPKGEFDSSHIPLTRLGNWMDSSMDGADDIFCIGPLSEQLGLLRGTPYTYNGETCYDSELSIPVAMATTEEQSLFSTGGSSESPVMYQPLGTSSLDGYFEFEELSQPNDLAGFLDTEATQNIGQDLMNSLLQQVSDDEFQSLRF